ncbi:MAG: tetratricopeptide repeat protein, partial [Kiloniellales bacterium]
MIAGDRSWLLLGGILAVAGALSVAPAAADDETDCAGSDPAHGIPACTRLVERAGTADGELAKTYVNRAKHQIVASQLDAASADLEEALRRDPGNADAHHNRGVVFTFQGRYEEALAALDEAIRLAPQSSAESHHTRGRIFTDLGNWDAATAEFEAAIRIDPRHVDALISLATVHHAKGEVDQAIRDLDRALGVDPQNYDAYTSRGNIYLGTSRFAEAIADFDRAIEVDPSRGTAFSSRGMVHMFQRQFDRAVADFGEAIRREPDNGQFYLQRATT